MAVTQFEARVRQQSNVAIIDLNGEINAEAEGALNTAYAAAASTPSSCILLNFKNTSYINSTGIALIVSLLAQAHKDHRALSACGLSEHYREIFEITRLADFITIHPGEASALRTTGV